jgi:hypothetical protein
VQDLDAPVVAGELDGHPGVRRVWAELVVRGVRTARKRVWRLMRSRGPRPGQPAANVPVAPGSRLARGGRRGVSSRPWSRRQVFAKEAGGGSPAFQVVVDVLGEGECLSVVVGGPDGVAGRDV